ncbi:MAG: toprim domain-containing protein [bacterium]
MKTDFIKDFVQDIKKIPGIRLRQAEKIAYSILEDEKHKKHLVHIAEKAQAIRKCENCGCFMKAGDECENCSVNTAVICVVPSISDVISIERSGEFKGAYHVLGGLISPLDNIMPEDLSIDSLDQRADSGDIEELILAVPDTIEGEATVSEIVSKIDKKINKISRIARGVPSRSGLGNMDTGTITFAFRDRKEIHHNSGGSDDKKEHESY